ncbi:hypothetical protein SS1G_09930 [Sclerotinia sclerotiorum 1980 UF-70]|uniref:Uncharacterized protein n=1 Tax=Sclerotinia sclerotiorum (strain ATCC 18683 / 1980 / Ss-1) TaxID=665079 RepID=A7EX70_SCLS1|nr:hypothetical protein SS1G_09930 [Sclerotinia sclerotiorum 1980 UF-70]EDN94062.1 hypothetical protein SS1G_09930 [Sclerotinia sclerotiorum 1980 UF-70]
MLDDIFELLFRQQNMQFQNKANHRSQFPSSLFSMPKISDVNFTRRSFPAFNVDDV